MNRILAYLGCSSGQIVFICHLKIVDGNIFFLLCLVEMHKCSKSVNLVLYLF